MPPKCYTTFEAKIMLTFAVFLSVMSPIFPINLLSFVYFQLLLIFIMAVVDTLAVYAPLHISCECCSPVLLLCTQMLRKMLLQRLLLLMLCKQMLLC